VTYLDNAEIDGRYLRAELAKFPPDELVNMYRLFITPDIKRLREKERIETEEAERNLK
jgi:hypothetical protein